MSLSDLYHGTKAEKKESDNKVVFNTHATEIKADIEMLSLTLGQVQGDVKAMGEKVEKLNSLNMGDFLDKHARMKGSYNELVQNYNMNQTHINTVVVDMGKRLNEIESKLSL